MYKHISMGSFSTPCDPSMVSISLLVGLLMLSLGTTGVQSIGVCYGMLGNNLPSSREVVDFYKSQNIGRMRIYAPVGAALDALKGSNIELLVGVPNEILRELSRNPSTAKGWVQDNVRNYWPSVKFRYIAVGNEVIPGNLSQFVLPAMRNIYNAISSSGLRDQVKVSTAIHMGVLEKSYPPSQGSFGGAANQHLKPIVQFLATTGAPLLANVYPYFSYVGNPKDISLSYALFTSPSTVVHDGSLQYQNLFDAMLDALHSAVERAGGSNVKIVVSESGWPSAGSPAATIENARIYNSNLIKHVSKGTPKKPGRHIETYIFAMFNENQKPGDDIERNFGLFYPSKKPVYPINFSP
ncbi:hypothetical protein AAC387_Pa03g1272 [Persea americana]